MDLASLTTALRTVLAGLPYTVAEDLDAGGQVKRPADTAIGDLNLRVSCLRLRVESSGTDQSSPVSRTWLAIILQFA
ncbi:hypothetical protein MASR1M49_27530 [Pararhodobacter aggregans]